MISWHIPLQLNSKHSDCTLLQHVWLHVENFVGRLNMFPIAIQPLCERPEDIPPLVWAFVRQPVKKSVVMLLLQKSVICWRT